MLNFNKIPNHIGIIMDGNGRWATKRGLPRNFGHRAGVKAIERTILACQKFGIKFCTFFAFSTENWKRSKEEINGIFNLLREYLAGSENFFIKNKIKLNSIGVLSPFPYDLQDALKQTIEKTKEFDGLVVVLALNYGGRDDIVRAYNKLIKDGIKQVDEKIILNYLDTSFLPEPDFVIRTSGEERISNFMLYQMAYSELYFPKVYWPDFGEKHLKKCLKIYQKRNRRYGGIK